MMHAKYIGRASIPAQSEPKYPEKAKPNRKRVAEIIQASYSLIAEKGFEGLRTRDVAEKVGINVATLHYYFPTKEALISGVVSYLMKELQTPRTNLGEPASATERLRAEFEDVGIRLKESPHQLVVLTELAVRSLRDTETARILQTLDRGWRGHLKSIFEAGIKEKLFRSDLDPELAANAMMTLLRGLGYQGMLEPTRIDQLISALSAQTEFSVLARPAQAKPNSKAKRKRLSKS